jgi:hypothetical protein
MVEPLRAGAAFSMPRNNSVRHSGAAHTPAVYISGCTVAANLAEARNSLRSPYRLASPVGRCFPRLASEMRHAGPENASLHPFCNSLYNSHMIDLAHLRDRQIAFRLMGSTTVNAGVVKLVEKDGIWVEASNFATHLQADTAWRVAMTAVQPCVFFFPISSFAFLVVKQD